MSEHRYETAPVEQQGMPAGVPYIIGNEAAERFSYYGMKAILALFMTTHLHDAAGNLDTFSDAQATKWIHNFVAATYFFPLLGAILSDWLLGKYRTILYLSLVYCAGHGVLALMDAKIGVHQQTLLFWGLALIAIGAGGIKPCVSAHVGDQFGRMNQYLLPVIFAWFYFSINFGSTISTLLTPELAASPNFGYSWAFGVPGVLMAIATFVFWLGRNKFVHVPPAGGGFVRQMFKGNGLKVMANLIPLFLFVAPFWAIFDQSASRWVLQAQQMDRRVFGWVLRSDQFQAVNPILVMAFIPLFSYVVYPLMGKFFKVTPMRKIGIGLFLVLPSFLIPAWVESRLTQETSVFAGDMGTDEEREQNEALRKIIRANDPSATVISVNVDRSVQPTRVAVLSVDPDRLGGGDSDGLEAFREHLSTAGYTDIEMTVESINVPSIGWQILAYIFLTAAEVMISITCLEFSYTQAPNEMKSYIMGLYLLFSVAVGNQITAWVNAVIEYYQAKGVELLPGASYYWFFTGFMTVSAVLFVIWSRTYRGQTYLQDSPVEDEFHGEDVPPREV